MESKYGSNRQCLAHVALARPVILASLLGQVAADDAGRQAPGYCHLVNALGTGAGAPDGGVGRDPRDQARLRQLAGSRPRCGGWPRWWPRRLRRRRCSQRSPRRSAGSWRSTSRFWSATTRRTHSRSSAPGPGRGPQRRPRQAGNPASGQQGSVPGGLQGGGGGPGRWLQTLAAVRRRYPEVDDRQLRRAERTHVQLGLDGRQGV
jgi:hypothetical protein